MSARHAAHRSVLPVLFTSLLALSLGAGCTSETVPPVEEPDETLTRPEGVALCYTELATDHDATKAFWQALGDGDHAARAAAIEGLEAAAKEYPDEEQFALLLGLANLWRVAEPLPEDEAVFVQSALAAKSELERAYELCPTDHRIAAWLGPVYVNMGKALNDQETIDQGLAVLQKGIDHYPSFVMFSKVLVYANEPATDPNFQNAVDAVYANMDYCAAEGGGFIADPACRNTAQGWHNIEGSMVFLGDVFAKAGRKDDALNFYQSAKDSDDYASWDWQSLLDDRIATLDDRTAAYTTEDTADDPDAAWTSTYQCAICHSR
jgi:tetratricopeptide (TPR) repeat protein